MMKKRALSFILALVLVMSAFPVSVFANINLDELLDSSPNVEQGFSMADELFEGVTEPIELNLPINPPQIDMINNKQSSGSILDGGMDSLQKNDIDEERYTVLVLDTSAATNFLGSDGKVFYTADTAIQYVKASAKKFIEQVQAANGQNNVAVVTYRGNRATVVSNFTTDVESLNRSIDNITASGGTRSVAMGIKEADRLISQITKPNSIKNVILFTTGMTNDGSHSYEGYYDENTIASNWQRSDTRIKLYAYANVAHSAADILKTKSTLYTIGLFQTMEDMPDAGRDVVQFFKLSTLNWATSSSHFYDVKDPNDLEFIFGDVADQIIKKEGKFKYAGQIVKTHDSESTYYYDDSYFLNDGTQYMSRLATMSLCFQLSTWPSHETNIWKNKTKNVRELLTGDSGIGFKEFEQNNDWDDVPTRDSIGVVAANKKIIDNNKEYTLIALAIRGGGYGSEWSSNFAIGESGSHAGFTKAKNDVLDFLEEYIEKHSIAGDVKIWVTGYSRAGATANLVGGALTDDYYLPNVSFEEKDLFIYTFAAPQGATKDDVSGRDYSGIHNIKSRNDAVPLVAPFTWEFRRYNTDRDLPSPFISKDFLMQRELMLKEFYKLEGASAMGYKIQETSVRPNLRFDRSKWLPYGEPLYTWEDSETIQNDILVDSVDLLAEEILVGRRNYYINLQDGISEVFGVLNEDDGKMQTFIKEFMDRVDTDVIVRFISPMLSLNPTKGFDKRINEVGDRVEEFVRINAREVARGLNINVTNLFIDSLANILREFIVNVAGDVWDNDTDSFNLLIKLVDIIKNGSLGQAHFPEIHLAWMMSQDINYNPHAHNSQVARAYRIVRINCSVDVKVYDSKRTNVASIINDVPQDLDSSIIFFVNDKGEKLIYLPGDEDYNIEIKGTDDGELTYSITEYDLTEGGISKLINYYEIPFTKGDTFTGTAPAFNKSEIENGIPDGSTVQYKLLDDSKGEILDREELVGTEIDNSYYRVGIKADNNSGFVDGAGNFLKGNFAKITAMPLTGSEFLGWYIGNDLVSTESVYRFAVTEDIKLTAKFEPVEIHELKLSSGVGGKIIGAEGYYTVGTEIGVSAEADPGYKFTEWTTTQGVLDSSTNSTAWFTMIDSDVIITANFESIEYDEWSGNLVTNKENKEWTIQLSMPVDEKFVQDSVFVLDKNNEKVDFIKIEVENDDKFGYIKLINSGKFNNNEDYWIIIKDSLRSTNGELLGRTFKAKFRLEELQ